MQEMLWMSFRSKIRLPELPGMAEDCGLQRLQFW